MLTIQQDCSISALTQLVEHKPPADDIRQQLSELVGARDIKMVRKLFGISDETSINEVNRLSSMTTGLSTAHSLIETLLGQPIREILNAQYEGKTLLYIATMLAPDNDATHDVAKTLLSLGADPNLVSLSSGITPLLIAVVGIKQEPLDCCWITVHPSKQDSRLPTEKMTALVMN